MRGGGVVAARLPARASRALGAARREALHGRHRVGGQHGVKGELARGGADHHAHLAEPPGDAGRGVGRDRVDQVECCGAEADEGGAERIVPAEGVVHVPDEGERGAVVEDVGRDQVHPRVGAEPQRRDERDVLLGLGGIVARRRRAARGREGRESEDEDGEARDAAGRESEEEEVDGVARLHQREHDRGHAEPRRARKLEGREEHPVETLIRGAEQVGLGQRAQRRVDPP
eukprot:gene7680-biopygen733